MNAAEQLSSDVTDDLQQSDVGLVRADHDGQLINDASNDANLDQGVRAAGINAELANKWLCLLYTSPSPRDATLSRMPSSA